MGKWKTLTELNMTRTTHYIMSDDFIFEYLMLLFGVFVTSMIKTLVFKLAYGVDMNDVICIELAIEMILIQLYVLYVDRCFGLDTSVFYLIIGNILFVTIAWMFGTSSGLRGLARHPALP